MCQCELPLDSPVSFHPSKTFWWVVSYNRLASHPGWIPVLCPVFLGKAPDAPQPWPGWSSSCRWTNYTDYKNEMLWNSPFWLFFYFYVWSWLCSSSSACYYNISDIVYILIHLYVLSCTHQCAECLFHNFLISLFQLTSCKILTSTWWTNLQL